MLCSACLRTQRRAHRSPWSCSRQSWSGARSGPRSTGASPPPAARIRVQRTGAHRGQRSVRSVRHRGCVRWREPSTRSASFRTESARCQLAAAFRTVSLVHASRGSTRGRVYVSVCMFRSPVSRLPSRPIYPALNATLAGDGSDVKRGELGALGRLRRLAVRGRRHLAARQCCVLASSLPRGHGHLLPVFPRSLLPGRCPPSPHPLEGGPTLTGEARRAHSRGCSHGATAGASARA
jgi:hypothetical protein